MVKDLNYFPLDVESNIYGMTKLEFEDMTSKILVATLDCRLYCINYCNFKPQTREVEFTYIPNGARIISIGALKRAPNDFVIGITHSLSPSFTKGASNPTRGDLAGDVGGYTSRQTTTYYLNIYASESKVFNLDHVAQGCQTIRLDYVPYHLYSTELFLLSSSSSSSSSSASHTRRDTKSGGAGCFSLKRKPIWLLSGGDESIHAYTEDKPCRSFDECRLSECFPELDDKQPSIALWIDVFNIEHDDGSPIWAERAIALGHEDGSVRLYQSVFRRGSDKFELIRASCFEAYSTIIPCVRLFKINSMDTRRSRLREFLNFERDRNPISDSNKKEEHHPLNELNLLVVSSTNESLVFRDVLRKGFEDKYMLPSSQRLDCVTTAAIGDTNASGQNELLLGTHGKELLTYLYDATTQGYQLSSVDIVNYPIFSLCMLDLTRDCLTDVAILLTTGVLVMQADVKEVLKLFSRRLQAIVLGLR